MDTAKIGVAECVKAGDFVYFFAKDGTVYRKAYRGVEDKDPTVTALYPREDDDKIILPDMKPLLDGLMHGYVVVADLRTGERGEEVEGLMADVTPEAHGPEAGLNRLLESVLRDLGHDPAACPNCIMERAKAAAMGATGPIQ